MSGLANYKSKPPVYELGGFVYSKSWPPNTDCYQWICFLWIQGRVDGRVNLLPSLDPKQVRMESVG